MDITLCLEFLGFGGENCAPDLSTYETMAAGWRASKPCPSAAEVEAAWVVVGKRTGALAQIRALETSVTDRRWREAGPDDAGGSADGRAWMADVDSRINILRGQLR